MSAKTLDSVGHGRLPHHVQDVLFGGSLDKVDLSVGVSHPSLRAGADVEWR